ncbi:MAG: hypothetical protein AAF573_03025, partial [Bacteroidota bacterium]
AFTKPTVFYHFEDLLVIETTSEGEHLWYHRIPKRNSKSKYFYTKTSISQLTQQNFYIIFNDYKYPDESSLKAKARKITIAKIDANSNLSFGILTPKSEHGNLWIIPQSTTESTNSDNLIIQVRDFKQIIFTKVKLE